MLHAGHMREAVAFDMDGLLCDTSSVDHLAADDFAAFQAAAVGCPPAQAYVDEARARHAAGHAVVVITSREFTWRDHTLDWLVAAGVPYDALYMRIVGDFRSAALVKAELATQAMADGFRITDAWDDSAEVRDVYASLGLRVHP